MTYTTVIYGPPGTGKTTRIIDILKSELDSGQDPKRVGLVSFTRAAAKELSSRLDNKIPKKWACTLHSMAFKTAQLSSKQLLTPDDLMRFSRKIGIPLTNSEISEGIYSTKQFECRGDEYLSVYYLAQSKVNELSEQYQKSNRVGSLAEFIYFCTSYTKFKQNEGVYDYSDILNCAMLAEGPPDIDILFVDEAQDLSNQQWTLLYKWLPDLKHIYLAGDDDQSIYGWGGAEPHGMAKFEKDTSATRIVLTQSHRIPKNVHILANKLISFIKKRVTKEYLPQSEKGIIKVWNTPIKELSICQGEDTLILYRNHRLRCGIEELLINQKTPYSVLSGIPGCLDSREAKLLRLWHRIKHDFENAELKPHELRWIKKYFKFKSMVALESNNFEFFKNKQWQSIFRFDPKISEYFLAIEDTFSLDVIPTVRLSTIHASKGMEADRVIIINAMGDKTRTSYYQDVENEIRTFYVGITRTKKRLDIVSGADGLPHLNRCIQGAKQGATEEK